MQEIWIRVPRDSHYVDVVTTQNVNYELSFLAGKHIGLVRAYLDKYLPGWIHRLIQEDAVYHVYIFSDEEPIKDTSKIVKFGQAVFTWRDYLDYVCPCESTVVIASKAGLFTAVTKDGYVIFYHPVFVGGEIKVQEEDLNKPAKYNK